MTGEFNEELSVKDVTWINASGAEMQAGDWNDGNMKCFGMLMDGRAQVTGIRRRGQDSTLLMVINGFHDVVGFVLTESPGGKGWELLIDTNRPAQEKQGVFPFAHQYEVTGRSVLLFLLDSESA